MSSSTSSVGLKASAVQKDWDDREFVEVVQLNILKTASFLNEFDLTVRSKLAILNEKLNKVERAIEYCEGSNKLSLEANSNSSGPTKQ